MTIKDKKDFRSVMLQIPDNEHKYRSKIINMASEQTKDGTMDILDMELSSSTVDRKVAVDISRSPSPHQLSADVDLEVNKSEFNDDDSNEDYIVELLPNLDYCPDSQDDIEMEEAELETEYEEPEVDHNYFDWPGNADGMWYATADLRDQEDRMVEQLLQRKQNVVENKVDHQNY